MNQTLIRAILFTAITFSLLMSCKKNNNATPRGPVCNITTILDSQKVYFSWQLYTYKLSYDSAGRLIHVAYYNDQNSDSGQISLAYYDQLFTKHFAFNNGGVIDDSVFLEKDGRINYFYYNNYSLVKITDYSYDVNGQLRDVISGNYDLKCQWLNGDLVQLSSGYSSDSASFQYYPDKPSISGDYLQVLALEQIADINSIPFPNGVQNAHLIKQIQGYSYPPCICNYSFDSAGRISNIHLVENNVPYHNIALKYTCQ